jgi:hypothetical protein
MTFAIALLAIPQSAAPIQQTNSGDGNIPTALENIGLHVIGVNTGLFRQIGFVTDGHFCWL